MQAVEGGGGLGVTFTTLWQSPQNKVSTLPASGILQLSPFSSLSLLSFPKSHPMCLIAALRHTLLNLPLLFDSLSLSLLVLFPSPPLFFFFFLPWATSPPHFTRHQFIFTFSSYHPSRVSTTSVDLYSLCWLPVGPVPIILCIDLCCIDER